MRVKALARISPRPRQGSSERPLNPLDDALPAGSLEARAHLARLFRAAEGANHGTEVDAFGAEIDPVDHRLLAAELAREFRLEAAECGLCIGFAPLRGDLHGVAAAAGRRGNR